MRLGQFVEEARGDGRLPHAVNAAIGDEPDLHPLLAAGDADIGQPALFLEAGATALVEGALMGKQPLLPAGQEDGLELQPLGRVQRHDRDGVHLGVLLGVHDQRHMLQEGGQRVIGLHGADEFLEVLQSARRLGRAIVLPHLGVAGFLEDLLGEVGVLGGGQLLGPAHQIGDHPAQRVARLGLQLLGFHHLHRRRDQRHAAGAGIIVQQPHGGVAEPALGRVDDPLEGQIVGRLADAAEIGERVAHLHPLVEARTADHPVVQPHGDEAVLELAHLERGAHQDRHVVEIVVLAPLQILDRLADRPRLLLRIPAGIDLDLLVLGVGIVGEQRLAEPVLVMGDQMRGRAEDVGGGAIIALQPDHRRAGKVPVEAQDVVDLGAAPAIDRLVVVADAADVDRRPLRRARLGGARLRHGAGARRLPKRGAAPGLAPHLRTLGQKPQPEILGDVGVLVLVHQDVAEAVVILGEDVRVVPEDGDRMQQEIAEIAGVEGLQPRLIGGVEFPSLAVGEGPRVALGNVLRRQRLVLPAIQHVGEGAGRPALVVEILGLDELLDQPDLVVGVENGEVRLQPGEFRVAAQDLHADRVEGAEPRHALDLFADQKADALLHLARGLVGEGHGEDLRGPGPAGGEDMGDARRQDARLARAGAGQHQHRALGGLHGGALLGIEAGEIVRRAGIAGHPAGRQRTGGDAAGTGRRDPG